MPPAAGATAATSRLLPADITAYYHAITPFRRRATYYAEMARAISRRFRHDAITPLRHATDAITRHATLPHYDMSAYATAFTPPLVTSYAIAMPY